MSYTPEMVARLERAQPLDLAIAKKLASDLGVSYRSVISKAKQMNFTYVAKAPAAKKDTLNKVTKNDLVLAITGYTKINFVALDKANMADLLALATYLESLTVEDTTSL